MKKIVNFFRESIAEFKEVNWPKRDDVVSSTKVVIVSTLIFAAILGLVDFVLLKGLFWIF